MSRSWRGKSGSLVWIDLTLTVLIALFAGLHGASVGRSQQGQFYQKHFAPAVMLAWGFGYRQPTDYKSQPGLLDFLEQRSQAVEPPAPGTAVATQNPDQFQQVHRYLIGSVGVCWWLLGVSWQAVWPIYAILFAMTLVAVYWLGRAWLSPILSVVLVIAFGCSQLVASNLPSLRDYSKAPFILAAVAICFHIVRQPITRSGLVCLSAFAGITIGVGLGFRMDLITVAPCVVLAVGLFSRVRCRHASIWRILALAVFVFAAVTASWPILAAFRQGSNSWHVVVLGLMSQFDSALKVLPADTHELGFRYNDLYVQSILNDFAHHSVELPRPARINAPGYDRVGLAYYLTVLQYLPADIAIRAISSVRLICSTGFASIAAVGLQILVPLVLVYEIARRNRSNGFFAVILIVYAGALMSLQFHTRHHFYLLVVPALALCVMSQEAIDRVLSARALARLTSVLPAKLISLFGATGLPSRAASRGWLILVAICVFASFAALEALRKYQSISVSDLQRRLAALPISACSYEVVPVDERLGTIALVPNSSVRADTEPQSCYWFLELQYAETADCDFGAVRVLQDCGDVTAYEDDSRLLSFDVGRVARGDIAVRYVFFTFPDRCSRFRLVLEADCLPVVRRFCPLDAASQLPVPMNVFLPVAGRELVPYQRLRLFDRDTYELGPKSQTFPSAMSRSSRAGLMSRAELNQGEIRIQDPATVVRDGRLEYDAVPPAPFHYIAALPTKSSSGGEIVVVRGNLERGGIGVGLLRDGKWAGQLQELGPGPFEFFLCPIEGDVKPVLYHVTPEGASVFKIDRFDWVQMPLDLLRVRSHNGEPGPAAESR